MSIGGFPKPNTSNGSGGSTNAVTSVSLDNTGIVEVLRNNSQSSQSFQIPTSINNITLDTNGDFIADYTNNVDSNILFNIGDSIDDISLDNNDLYINYKYRNQDIITLPNAISSAYANGINIEGIFIDGTESTLFTLPNALTSIYIDYDTIMGEYIDGTEVNLITLPNTINSIILNDKTLTVTYNYSNNMDLTLPDAIFDWVTNINAISGSYYRYEGYMWKCITTHTSATFDIVNYDLVGNEYTFTLDNTSSYIIPSAFKENLQINIKLTGGVGNFVIDITNMKISQTLTVEYVSGSYTIRNLEPIGGGGSGGYFGDISDTAHKLLILNSDFYKKMVIKRTSNSTFYGFYENINAVVASTQNRSQTPLFAVSNNSGTTSKFNILSTWSNTATSTSYDIYAPKSHIRLDKIPSNNGNVRTNGDSAIVTGSNNNASSSSGSAIITGSNNSVFGSNRVVITGAYASTTQGTPFSYRETGFLSTTNNIPNYTGCSDISIIQKIMSDNTYDFLSISGNTPRKVLVMGYANGRKNIGIHDIWLFAESNTDFLVKQIKIVYSGYGANSHTLEDFVETYSYSTPGAIGWSYNITDVSDNYLKIIPTGGDFWNARITSIYNGR